MKPQTVLVLATLVALTVGLGTFGQRTAYGYGSTLYPGQYLYPGQHLLSPNGVFQLLMQTDGNLVLYHVAVPGNGVPARALWASNTSGSSVSSVIMQSDGNLVIYNTGGAAIWASNTSGNPGAYLVDQDDGNVVIYRTNGTAAWATNTDSGSHSPEKRLFVDRWYQRLSDSGSYQTWMTLSSHRHYESSGLVPAWATPITNAFAAYNAASFPDHGLLCRVLAG